MATSILQNATDPTPNPDTGLSAAQLQVAHALAQGATVTAAAEAAGVHRTTVHHWMRHQTRFAGAVQRARAEYTEALNDELRELSAEALKHLRALLEDPETPAAVRLRACLAILERPRYPQQGWTLPVPVNTPRQEDILRDLAEVEADYRLAIGQERLEKATGSPIPRNAPCPCGSGKKFKRCCGGGAPPVLS